MRKRLKFYPRKLLTPPFFLWLFLLVVIFVAIFAVVQFKPGNGTTPQPGGRSTPSPSTPSSVSLAPTAIPELTAIPEPTATPEATAVPDEWKLTWDDEFDDTRVDTSKWGVQDARAGGYDDNYHHDYDSDNTWAVAYRSSNVTESGGLLHLTTRHETYGDKSYTSGSIGSWNKKLWLPTPGHPIKVVVNARLPQLAHAHWPAIWMVSEQSDTDRNGAFEMDLMEAGDASNQVYVTYHDNTYGYGKISEKAAAADYAADFHTYELEWDTTYITMRVDGKDVLHVTSGIADKPAWLTIDDNIDNGQWFGYPDDSTAANCPTIFDVDYVRVYQK